MITSRTTQSERVYREIKSLIFHREFLPGDPLVAQTLADRLSVSRMPVVEAIRRLERDGLVEVVPHWGAQVKRWASDEIVEAFAIRRALEGEAARFFVLRATVADKSKLVELNRRYDACSPSAFEFDEADIALHLHIARATRFERLYELIESCKIATSLIHEVTRRVLVQKTGHDAIEKRRGTHSGVISALLGSSPEVAVQAMLDHIEVSFQAVLPSLEEH